MGSKTKTKTSAPQRKRQKPCPCQKTNPSSSSIAKRKKTTHPSSPNHITSTQRLIASILYSLIGSFTVVTTTISASIADSLSRETIHIDSNQINSASEEDIPTTPLDLMF